MRTKSKNSAIHRTLNNPCCNITIDCDHQLDTVLSTECILISPIGRFFIVVSPTSNLFGNEILRELTVSGEDVGHIRSESIRYGLEVSIEELIQVYDSVVDGNVRFAILSIFLELFYLF